MIIDREEKELILRAIDTLSLAFLNRGRESGLLQLDNRGPIRRWGRISIQRLIRERLFSKDPANRCGLMAGRVFHLAPTFVPRTTTATHFVAKSTARCNGRVVVVNCVGTLNTGVATERAASPFSSWKGQGRFGERRKGGRGKEGNGGDRVGGGACQEQTTAAILHVNGISKRMIRCVPSSVR